MDDIRRRLAEIDEQLDRSHTSYYRQIATTAPLLFCAAGMIAGIIIQDKTQLPLWVWTAAVIVCFVVAVALLMRRWKQPYAGAYLALACFACVGAIRLANFNQPKPNDIRNLVANKATPATIRGVIASKPYIDSNEWAFSRFAYTDPGSSFYLEMTEAETVKGWVKTTGLTRVRVNEPIFDLKAGDHVQMYCWLDRFGNATNPGEFDIAKYLARRGVFIGASVESRGAIELLQSNTAGVYAKIRGTLQKIATQALIGPGEPQGDEEGLLLALVLGYRSNIDKSTLEAFRQTGLLHFICLSGMNFAMVIGFVWWVCKTAGLMKPARAVVCILSAVLFLLVVPENAPAFRAAVMCFAFCGAFIFRRKSNPFNSLSLAAIVLLLISPTGIFEPSWQLSFVSVVGILLLAKPINRFIREKATDLFDTARQNDGTLFRIIAGTGSVIADLFSVSFAAWLSIAGIMLYHFYTIQWLTSIWTVLLSPLIGLVSFLGYSKLITAFISPSIASLIGWAANILSDWLIRIVKLIAGLNISEILVGKTSTGLIILYYAIIMSAFFFRLRRLFVKKCILASVTILLIAIPLWQKSHGNRLVITALDVGHGQAILAQLPDGANILFDAGSLSRNDIGTRVILPFMRYKGISEIDSVVISHSDIDHINGIPEVNENSRIESFYATGVGDRETKKTVMSLKELIEVRDINEIPKQSGSTKIKVLWPSTGAAENVTLNENDKSIVTMLEYAGRRILICSDIQKFAQGELLKLYPDLRADVVIAPHHGSIKTLDEDFIPRLGPDIVICSCNSSAYEKGQVIKDRRLRVLYTGIGGAITVHIGKEGAIETNTFAK